MKWTVPNASTEPLPLPAVPALLNEREAALFLGGLSLKGIYNLRRRGELPYVRLGSRVMYSRSSLERMIAEREQKPQGAK